MSSYEEVSNVKLTSGQAYLAMSLFIEDMHGLGWKALGGLLGSMAMIDGLPMDVALVDDWSNAVRLASDSEEGRDALRYVDETQAYAAMFNFLEKLHQEGREDLGSLVGYLKRTDGVSLDEHIALNWDNAFDFAFSGGKTRSVELINDDQVIEVHRGKLLGDGKHG